MTVFAKISPSRCLTVLKIRFLLTRILEADFLEKNNSTGIHSFVLNLVLCSLMFFKETSWSCGQKIWKVPENMFNFSNFTSCKSSDLSKNKFMQMFFFTVLVFSATIFPWFLKPIDKFTKNYMWKILFYGKFAISINKTTVLNRLLKNTSK